MESGDAELVGGLGLAAASADALLQRGDSLEGFFAVVGKASAPPRRRLRCLLWAGTWL